ncbi:MAG: hypothetical protein IIC60_06875 [Proteobacteria bacterium]|nr:hypothetical protein [Pseudomonadota bacterium]
MLGKILLTAAVIVIAFFFIRQRNLAAAAATETKQVQPSEAVQNPASHDNLAADLRLAAYMFLVLMLGLGGAMYYFRWQDDHTILTVTLHRDDQVTPTSYQVYKYQLQDRSFITVDGTSVAIASSERMEVFGLDQ